MKYRVLKPIPVDNGSLPSGTIVDAEGWRNLRTLLSGRYLEAAPDAEVEAKPAPKPKAAKPAAKKEDAEPVEEAASDLIAE